MSIRDAAKAVLKLIRRETLDRTAEKIRHGGLSEVERARVVRNTLAFVRTMDWLIGDRPPAPPGPPPPTERCIAHDRAWPCAECERLWS